MWGGEVAAGKRLQEDTMDKSVAEEVACMRSSVAGLDPRPL